MNQTTLVVSVPHEFWSYVQSLPGPHSGTTERVVDARGNLHVLVSDPKDLRGHHHVRVVFHGAMKQRRDFWYEMLASIDAIEHDDSGSYRAKGVTDGV